MLVKPISFENAAVSGDEINVYHVTDDASAVTEVATNTQSFDANHFSIYVITGEKEKPLTTFKFVDANGKSVSTQIVKTGDTLITPTAPDVAGKAFVGWYEGETKFEDFNTALTITETKTRTITAKYENALYVYFYNPAGTQIMRTEKVGDHEVHGYTDVSYDVDSTHKLVGWAAERNGTTNIAASIAVPTDKTSVNVYAIIKEGYWISFDSDGGSIVDSQFVLNGDKLVLDKNTNPTKPGYTFAGWYNDSTKVENGATVTNPMTLKAHWDAAQVNYTINYWQQKVTDDKNATDAQKTYEYVEAETKKATTGTPISAENLKTYKGFKYNANNSSKDVKISGDGSTIINVYYDRVLCTVNFYAYESTGWFGGGSWNIIKTVTGLYGANLPKGAWDTSTYSWKSRKSDGSGCVLLTSFDFETAGYAKNQGNVSEKGIVTTCNFYGSQQSGSGKINYYNEQADGSYVLAQSITTRNGTLTVHEKFAGYDLYKYSTGNVNGESAAYWNDLSSKYNVSDGDDIDHERNKPINIASKLKTYSLSYYNYNKVTKTEKNIKYTASLKSYANYTPAKPSELPSYYVFGGWYKDKACTTKFDFNTEKMPNANVQIYAKWTAKKINLTYNLNTPDGTSKKVNSDVEAGTIASTVLPSATTISDYSFAGWYYADGNGNITKDAFNANEAITKDTSVIGKWLYNGELKVVYHPGTEESKATVPKDSNIYAGGAKVTVAKNATTTSKKKFLGWKLNGNLYHPGDAFEVNKNLAHDDNVITLTAEWGSEEHSTTMSYNPGYGRGSVQTVPVKNNASVTLQSEKDFGYQAPETEGKEYYFAGWATSMDDAKNGKATYAAGQTVHVDVNGENVLYATWIEKTVITLFANSNNVPYTGQMQEVNGFVSLTIDGYTVSGLNAHAQGTDVGTYPTEIKGTAHVEKGNQDVTNKVVVKTTPGQLTITKAETMTLTPELTGKDAEKEYDSKPLSGGATASVTKGTKITYSTDGGKTWSETLPSITNVGTLKVKAKAENKNYKDVTVDYTLTVTRKAVTVTADNKSKVFGEKDPELTATVAGTLGEDTVKYDVVREAGENVGKYTITPSGKAEQGNYSVSYVAGTLTITSQSIDPGTDPEKPNPDYTGAKVNSPSDEVYDGNEHKWIPTVTDKADKKLEAGKDYTVEYSTKNFKDVGTIDVTITGIGNYTGTVTRTYKITPKSVTVTAEDKTKVFGETDPKFTAKVVGTLGNDTVEYTLSRETGEAAGKYEITVKGDKLQGNYTVTYVAGKLTITSQSIDPGTDPEKPNPDYTGAKVNSPSDEVYDGNEHKWIPTVTDKAKTLELGKDYTVEYSTKNFKDVGTVEVTITGIGNYSGTVKRSYKVTPKEYTVTTDSATKTYSGTALTAGGKVEGIVSGETVEFTTTGSQTEVGTSKNTYELVWKSAKATNYTLAKESIGKLTVKAKSIVPDDKDTPELEKTGITVSEPSDSKYDGKEHREVLTVTDTKTGKELVAGTDYSVTYSSDLVNAGTVKVTVAGLGNYSGSFAKTYKITKRSVTLTSATVSKVYDGSALTNTSIAVSGDGFVEGEGASYEVTGTQTEVGNSANAFEYKLNENTLASNYNITKVVGTLTITAAPAPVTPATPSTPSSTTRRTPRTPSAPQVTTPAETVEKETTPKAEPKKEEKVEEEYTPKASPQYYCALINLICAILTVLFGLLLLISKRHKSEDDDDEEDDETKQQTNNDDEENEQEKKRGLFTRVLAVLIAILSVVFFLVTEDLSLPWTWTDQWTIWMVVIGLVQIVVFFVGRKWKNVDNDDDDEEAQQA
ncbi:MBG domain-containing protein [Holdemanella porci]|uniref:MBG domain-containing protein n=1 Tax=Holdemanella porci TaxID=2652276 RepID=UPI003AF0391A